MFRLPRLVPCFFLAFMSIGMSLASEKEWHTDEKGKQYWTDKEGCRHYPCPPCEAMALPQTRPAPPPQEAECPKCGECPQPAPAQTPEDNTAQEQEQTFTTTFFVASEEPPPPPKGRWYIPVSLFHVDDIGIGIGIAYQFPKGIILSGQALYRFSNGTTGSSGNTSVCEDALEAVGYSQSAAYCEKPAPRCLDVGYSCPGCEKSRWGAIINTLIPIPGKRKKENR